MMKTEMRLRILMIADDESESDDGVEYDENGDPVDNAGASDDVEYDEYGNVIDSDNNSFTR